MASQTQLTTDAEDELAVIQLLLPLSPVKRRRAHSTATTDASRAQRSISLPPELWLEIFASATCIPGALDTSDAMAVTSFAADTHGINLHNRHADAMDVNLAIMLVCKAWRSLGTRSFFRYILIKSLSQMLQLAAVLEEEHFASRDGRPAGHYVLRFEIALEGVHDWMRGHSVAFARILDLCPNLRVFSNMFCIAETGILEHPQVLKAFGKLMLTRLELRGTHLAFLHACAPTLEVLWLSEVAARTAPEQEQALDLRALHTVVYSQYRDMFFGLVTQARKGETLLFEHLVHTLQDLRHICLPSFLNLEDVLPHCQRLESLSYSQQGFTLEEGIYDQRICDALFGRNRRNAVDEPVLQHRTLRTLAIRDCPEFSGPLARYGGMSGNAHCSALRSALEALTSASALPALQSLRVSLPLARPSNYKTDAPPNEDEALAAFRSVWFPWLADCQARGIKLEAAVGAKEETAGRWRPLGLSLLLQVSRGYSDLE